MIWVIYKSLFNIENKMIKLLIIKRDWIVEVIVFFRSFLIGCLFFKCVLCILWKVNDKEGFWVICFFGFVDL